MRVKYSRCSLSIEKIFLKRICNYITRTFNILWAMLRHLSVIQFHSARTPEKHEA